MLVKELGGIPIDYKHEDFTKRIIELTGDGVDYVFEGMGLHWWSSYRILRKHAMFVEYGMGSFVGMSRFHFIATVISKLFTLLAMKSFPDGKKARMFSLPLNKARHPEWIWEDLTTLFQLLRDRKIKPVIAQCFPLSEAAAALELLESGNTIGKLVLTCA